MGPIPPIASSTFSTSQPVATPAKLDALSDAAAKLNTKNAFGDGSEVVVKVDDRTHHFVVQVVNRETNEVIRQLAPPTVFLMARSFR